MLVLIEIFTFILALQHGLAVELSEYDRAYCMKASDHPNYKYIDNPTCGHVDEKRDKQLVESPRGKRMVGGDEVSLGAFPWMAHFRIFTDDWGGPLKRARTCLGAIIGIKHIITTGSCLYTRKTQTNFTQVFVGKNIMEQDDCVTLNNITKCAPDYLLLKANQTHINLRLWKYHDYDHDIALLQLETNISFSGFVRPICLSEKCLHPNDYTEEEFTMVGYGYHGDINADNITDHRILKAVGIGVRKDDCQKRWRRFDRTVKITNRVICVDPEDQANKPCKEDLGSALIQEIEQVELGVKVKVHVLVGLLAFGLDCREQNPVINPPPLVYTNIGVFTQWIVSNLSWKQWIANNPDPLGH